MFEIHKLTLGRNINWTAEVTDGILNNRLKDYQIEFRKQLEEVVALVRTGGLTKALRNTLEALIISDSHADTGWLIFSRQRRFALCRVLVQL